MKGVLFTEPGILLSYKQTIMVKIVKLPVLKLFLLFDIF